MDLAPDFDLRAESVSLSFGGLRALSAISVTVKPREIVGLIGPNGAGKTTLLNVLTGFLEPNSGRVMIGEQDASGWTPQQMARAGVVRTFQGVRPFANLTVRENVEVGALGVGASAKEARLRAENLLKENGLAGSASLPGTSLPAGFQRRLGMARALAAEPRVLLLDEPAAGLSEPEADELMAIVRRARDALSCGVVVVEHTMRVVMALCERLHVLDHGETLATGDPEQVRSNPRVIEAYLGTASGAHA